MINVLHSRDNERRYVFVCGLHRSGTSLLGRNVARLENCTGFSDTGVIEDEGQFLQDVYCPSRAYGGPGRFGFDPRAHLTESSPLVTLQNALKLRESWERYWDPSKAICVEKTPGNLLKTRFLQAMFPNTYFVVIRRHPVSVSMANQKWKESFASIHKLFDHWLCCHARFEQDKKHLNRVYELTYEDYIENPEYHHQEIARFISTCVPEGGMEEVIGAYNQKYFSRWSELLNDSPVNCYYRYIAFKYEPMFRHYGYSLTEGLDVDGSWSQNVGGFLATRGTLYCVAADLHAQLVRVTARSSGLLKKQLRARSPAPVRLGIQPRPSETSLIRGTRR